MFRRRVLSLGLLCLLAAGAFTAALTASLGEVAAASPEDVVVDFHGGVTDYLQGSTIVMYFNTTRVGVDEVTVSCPTCPVPATYRAKYAPRLRFPTDFGAPIGEPRWSGTYRVSLLDTLDNTMFFREFKVHATDAFRHENRTLNPFQTLQFASSGFIARSRVEFQVWRLTEFGQPQRYDTFTATADATGRATYNWVIPLEITPSLKCPRSSNGPCRDFWVEPRGTGKTAPPSSPDRSGFRIEPATAVFQLITAPGQRVPTDYNRTEIPEGRFVLYYPQGFPLTHREAFAHLEGKLRMNVYRNSTLGAPPELVAPAFAVYSTERNSWFVNWTIPRDAPYVGYQYFFRLEAQEDRYGTVIRQRDFGGFQVHPVDVEARFVRLPTEVQRTDTVQILLSLRYKDDKPVEPALLHPEDDLAACLVPVGEERSPPCLQRQTFLPKHLGGGLYAYTVRFPVDATPLKPFRIHLQEEARDTAGSGANLANRIVRNSTLPISLVPANLTIRFETAVASSEKEPGAPFERGDRVTFIVDITYPDGKPFNVERNLLGETLALHVFQRNSLNRTTNIFDVTLRNLDRYGGRWVGTLELPLIGGEFTSGLWEFQVDPSDKEPTANRGLKSHFHPVKVTRINLLPDYLSPRVVLAGTTVDYTFRLLYPDGSNVGSDQLGLTPRVDVHVLTKGELGAVVQRDLIPTYDAQLGIWRVSWVPPRTSALTSHVFVVRATDLSGNEVDRTPSIPFDVYVEQVTRRVVTQPFETVERTDKVYVVFEGAAGDTGDGASGRPRIELQQRISATQWIPKVLDVTVANSSIPFDHVGAFEPSVGTPFAEYRFALYGRSADRAILTGVSRSFNITPTTVTRDFLVPPPASVEKGGRVSVVVVRQPGDFLGSASVYRGTFLVGEARLFPSGTNWTIRWDVPFTMDVGVYRLQVTGSDLFQNSLRISIPPFLVGDTGITSQSILQPPPTVPRGDTVRYTFRVYYPDGKLMTPAEGVPLVTVQNESGEDVAVIEPRYVRAVWEVTWVASATLPVGDYSFQVVGRDNFSNPIAPLRSSAFTVEPGTVIRQFATPPEPSYLRLGFVGATVASSGEDALISFTLGYLGRGKVSYEQVLVANPVPMRTFNYTWDPIFNRYVLETRLPKDMPVGFYTIDIQGVDRHGNVIKGRSDVLEVRPSQLQIEFDRSKPVEWGAGVTTSLTFRVKYSDGTFLTPEQGQPTSFVAWNGQPLGETLSMEYKEGYWTTTWQAPPVLPEGRYYIAVSGVDFMGNPVGAARSGEYFEEPTAFQRIFGVPGVGGLGAFGAVGLAALLAALGRRRDG